MTVLGASVFGLVPDQFKESVHPCVQVFLLAAAFRCHQHARRTQRLLDRRAQLACLHLRVDRAPVVLAVRHHRVVDAERERLVQFIVDKADVVLQKTLTSGKTNPLTQHVIAALMESRGFDVHLRTLRRRFAEQIARTPERLV